MFEWIEGIVNLCAIKYDLYQNLKKRRKKKKVKYSKKYARNAE